MIINNTNQATFDYIKDRIYQNRATIIRDGLTWTYNGTEWVSQ